MTVGWNHLPPEVKLHCLKELSFIDKCNVRRVNREGRDLIDCFKTTLRSLSIEKFSPPLTRNEEVYGWEIRACEETADNQIYWFENLKAKVRIDNWQEDAVPILNRILNQCRKIQVFQAENLPDDAFTQLHLHAPITIEKVTLVDLCPNDVTFVLNNVRRENIEGFESISVSHNHFPLRSVPTEMFHSVRMFNIHYESDPTLPAYFAKKWIEEDVDVGHKLQFSSRQFHAAILNNMHYEFHGRLIPPRFELVDRILMDDQDKMIIIKRERDDFSAHEFHRFIMMVVPYDGVDQAFIDGVDYEELYSSPVDYMF